MKFIANKTLNNEYSKLKNPPTLPPIPEGEEVQYIGTIENFKGVFAQIQYNSTTYYVHPQDLTWVEENPTNNGGPTNVV